MDILAIAMLAEYHRGKRSTTSSLLIATLMDQLGWFEDERYSF